MKILDCTLRDGGYYTNWSFSSELVEIYLKTVSKLPIECIELGYLSNTKDENGPFYHLNANILSFAKKILKKNQKLYAMINTKEVKDSHHLKNLILNAGGYIDGIRFAVDPNKVGRLLKILKPVKKKFPKISFNINLMYLSKWHKNNKFSKKVLNSLAGQVDVVSIVDSYGAMLPNEIKSFLIRNRNNKINLGCHFHNNCGLALASTLTAINNGCEFADSTFLGMGRGAGNAETELLLALTSQSKSRISSFEISNLLERLEPMKSKLKWGSSFSYAFAAREGFSQNKMMDLIQKRRLDPSIAVKAILNNEDNLKKIIFKKLDKLKKIIKFRPVIIGGGENFKSYGKILIKQLGKKTPIILSGSRALKNFASLNTKFSNPVIMLLSGNELKKVSINNEKNIFKKLKINYFIAEEAFLENKNILNYGKVVFSNSVAINPLLLAGLALRKAKLRNAYLAFFDGDSDSDKGKIVMKETDESLRILKRLGINFNSLTKTYLNVEEINPYT